MSIWRDTIDYMNDNYPFLVGYVLSMGKPVDDSSTLLAFVTWPTPDDPEFHLNEQVVALLTPEERVFVFMHETFHVLLNHNKLPFDDKDKANVAADIVINDYLVAAGLLKIKGLLYGEEIIGMDSNGLTVMEVYQMLPQDPPKPSESSSLGNLMQPNGSCGTEHLDPNVVPQKVLDTAPADLKSASEKESELGGKLGGFGYTDMEEWAKQQKVELAWAEVLEKINPTVFKGEETGKRRSTFNKLNRKVAWASPRVILPVYRDTKLKGRDDGLVPSVVLAIDTSGSVTRKTVDRFFRIAESIPQNKIKLRTISFTTAVVEFDLAHPKFARGGTSFQCIETWIKANCKPYPDAVICFTDGYTNTKFSTNEMGKWYFFICDGGYLAPEYARRVAMNENIERFVR